MGTKLCWVGPNKFVAEEIKEVAGMVFQAVLEFLEEQGMFARKRIPTFLEFLEGCHSGLSLDEWFRRHQLFFSSDELSKTFRPLEGYLETLRTTNPIFVARELVPS